jgi:hypothetical protein
MTTCKGFTTKGLQCKCKIKGRFGDYCSIHRYQKPIPFYPKLDNWPETRCIRRSVYEGFYLNAEFVLMQIIDFESRILVNPSPFFFEKEKIVYSERYFVICCVELLKLNANLLYGDERINYFVTFCIKHLSPVPEMKEYLEDFKRRCIKSYRDEARKKLIGFYLDNSLCPDIVDKIVKLVN